MYQNSWKMKHNKSKSKFIYFLFFSSCFLTYSSPRLCLQKLDKTIQTTIKKNHPKKNPIPTQNLRQFGMDDTPFPAQILQFVTGVLEQQISRRQ